MTLTPGQLVGLRNLARKQAGEDVEWISIADARALTDLGLAQRNPSGWEITRAGEQALASADPDASAPTSAPMIRLIDPDS